MRIGVDATCWANARGYGRFARQLMRAMAPLAPSDEFVCVGDRRAFEALTYRADNMRLVEVPVRESPSLAARADGRRSVRDMLKLSRSVAAVAPDVFFWPSVYSYFPLPPGLASVVTVHDTIADEYPELTLPTRRARLFWRLKVWSALRQARLVLTVSEYSARGIARVLGVSRERIRVAIEAPAAAYYPSTPAEVEAAALRADLPPGASWFIYVGGFNPHKRVDVILEAHAALARDLRPAPHLLLVGAMDDDPFLAERARLVKLIADGGTDALVHWTGFVPDDELRHLLGGAVALLLLSEREGFGLPAVEAAACGTPVIATTESPLPELLEGGGVFVRPGEVEPVVSAMRSLLCDPEWRRKLGTAARARASLLSWRAAARDALAAIREAAA